MTDQEPLSYQEKEAAQDAKDNAAIEKAQVEKEMTRQEYSDNYQKDVNNLLDKFSTEIYTSLKQFREVFGENKETEMLKIQINLSAYGRAFKELQKKYLNIKLI